MNEVGAPKLAAIPEALHRSVDSGDLAGIVYQTWQHGKLIQAESLGFRNLERREPMTQDTIFRIASMSRVPTSVAAMILVDRGELSLGDPITRWIPELDNRRVLRAADGPLDATVAAARAITVEDLLTHRSGIAYGFASHGPIAGAYFAELGNPADVRLAPDAWVAALATLPLSYQPGERMHYGHSTDLLGVLMERVLKLRLGEILHQLVFEPLGMTGTAFFLPLQDRLATTYRFDETLGALAPSVMPVPAAPPVFEAGGTGLVSTVGDYARLALMLLNHGEFHGKRVLKAETARAMRTNHLTPAQKQIPFIGRPIWDGMGFGLGLGIVEEPEKALLGYGSRGAFGWPGAWGTWWQADPANDLVMVYMIQHEMPLTADAGALIAGGRGHAGRMALSVFQKLTYAALAG